LKSSGAFESHGFVDGADRGADHLSVDLVASDCLTVAPSINVFLLNEVNIMAVLLSNHFDVLISLMSHMHHCFCVFDVCVTLSGSWR